MEAIDPPETVTTYIETNPGRTVALGGDVVVGAEVPGDVTFQEIPDYQYRYARINDRPVLIDPGQPARRLCLSIAAESKTSRATSGPPFACECRQKIFTYGLLSISLPPFLC